MWKRRRGLRVQAGVAAAAATQQLVEPNRGRRLSPDLSRAEKSKLKMRLTEGTSFLLACSSDGDDVILRYTLTISEVPGMLHACMPSFEVCFFIKDFCKVMLETVRCRHALKRCFIVRMSVDGFWNVSPKTMRSFGISDKLKCLICFKCLACDVQEL